MNIELEFELLKMYLNERLKFRKPMMLKDQMEYYSKVGIFNEGLNGIGLMSFEQWKLIFNYE